MSGDRLRRQYRFTTLPEHLIRDTSISDRALRLWCLLDRYAGANGEAFPTRHRLADDLSCSRASIDRALTELVDGGWLSKERREAGGSNDYTLLIAKAPKARRKSTKSQVNRQGGLTRDDTPLDSQVSAGGGLTSEDTLDSQVTQPVITGDAHKEASLSEQHLTESSDDSLRSSSAAESPNEAQHVHPATAAETLDGMQTVHPDGASPTRTIGADELDAKRRQKDEQAERRAEAERITRAFHGWYTTECGPVADSSRSHHACRGLIEDALTHYTVDEIRRALWALKRPVPNKREWQDALVAVRRGHPPVPPGGRRQASNVHHSGHPEDRRKVTEGWR